MFKRLCLDLGVRRIASLKVLARAVGVINDLSLRYGELDFKRFIEQNKIS